MVQHCFVLSILVGAVLTVSQNDDLDADPKGYLVYCPCMGRYCSDSNSFD